MSLRVLGAFIAGALTVGAGALAAQGERLTFDVISIKPAGVDTRSSGWRNAPGRITGTFTTRTLIALARSISPTTPFPAARIVGGPDWVDTARYSISAEAPQDGQTDVSNPAAFGRPLAPLLQTLLEDRFKLASHKELREFPVYALIVASNDGRLGPNLRRSLLTEAECEARRARPSKDAKPCGSFTHPGDPLTGVPVSRAIGFLGPVDRIVVDRTGLDGLFDITFQRDESVSVFTAVQEQLGLKLEPRRERLETVVIDHIERPTEN